ncbi:MAG: 16S rRNA (guanine(527)-N(7))-methyltransferase RsmG [Candidatus Meridianibacter frigidus]|nr:MAG: 16S rRNA (guanine(527)-N(7))-methyltransferase RsmG [Candidatus Eremiobacteraeota bacterium]
MKLAAEDRERLELYAVRLLEASQRINLTGAKGPEAVWSHIEDSLQLLPFVESPLVDVGSGGGFPAIPLAIAAGLEVTLIEATSKKAKFLQAIVRELDITGSVVADRAEAAAHDPALRGHFAAATGRAVGAAPVVAELTVPFLRTGGLAILQRGQLVAGEREAVEAAALMLGAAVEEKMAPSGSRLLLLRKIGKTPQRFPRRTGIPSKRPLGARFHGEHNGETANKGSR